MFRWAIIFAIIALIASLLGFGGVAGLSKDFAVILLVVAVTAAPLHMLGFSADPAAGAALYVGTILSAATRFYSGV